MKNILVTGFKPFGDYRQNTSEIVAHRIKDEKIPDFTINSMVFDPQNLKQNHAERILSMASAISAKGIISLGMASEKPGLCVEGVAINRVYHQIYVPENLQNTPIDATRLYQEKLDLDLVPWNVPTFQWKCLEKDIPIMTEISEDAGGFCCNKLIYQVAIEKLNSAKHIPFIFIHVPCHQEAVPDKEAFIRAGKSFMETRKVIEGIKLLLETALI